MKTIYYYYVRHGETVFNLENRMQGITDSPLTCKGIEQIAQTTEALRNEFFNSAYTSPLPRTIQTAEIILEPHHMHAKIFEPLREFSYGSWDGHIKNESDPEYQYRFSNDLLMIWVVKTQQWSDNVFKMLFVSYMDLVTIKIEFF